MGRTEIIFLISTIFLITVFLTTAYASSFDVKVRYYGSLDEYYTGGEYIYFVTKIEPETSSDARKLDGVEYEILSRLRDSGIIVEFNLTTGKTVLHPTPDDEYVRKGNLTLLKFFLPDLGKAGVDHVVVRLYGYVPEITGRLEDIPLVRVTVDGEKVAEKNITVINKHEFYEDIKKLKEEVCDENDLKKLDEALNLYYDEEFRDADEKIKEVEKSVLECKYEEKKRELEKNVESLRDELSDIRRDLTAIEVKLELNRDRVDYEKLSLQVTNLTAVYRDVDKLLDRAKDKIYEEEFEEAEKIIASANLKIQNLEKNVSALLSEVQQEKSDNLEWMWVLTALIIAVVVAVIGLAILRSRRGGL